MVDDEELEKLREEKRQEMQDDEEDQIEKQREQIKSRASQYLTSDAKSRLGNIRAARPELASQIETEIAQLGEMGRIEKIDDSQLKDILQNLQNTGDETDIKYRK